MRTAAEVVSIAGLWAIFGFLLWLGSELLRTDRPAIAGGTRRRTASRKRAR